MASFKNVSFRGIHTTTCKWIFSLIAFALLMTVITWACIQLVRVAVLEDWRIYSEYVPANPIPVPVKHNPSGLPFIESSESTDRKTEVPNVEVTLLDTLKEEPKVERNATSEMPKRVHPESTSEDTVDSTLRTRDWLVTITAKKIVEMLDKGTTEVSDRPSQPKISDPSFLASLTSGSITKLPQLAVSEQRMKNVEGTPEVNATTRSLTGSTSTVTDIVENTIAISAFLGEMTEGFEPVVTLDKTFGLGTTSGKLDLTYTNYLTDDGPFFVEIPIPNISAISSSMEETLTLE